MEQPSTIQAARVSVSDEWLSQDELVARWKVSKKTIRRLRQTGKLSALEITPQLFRFKWIEILRIESEGKLLPSIAAPQRRKPAAKKTKRPVRS